MDLGLPPRPDDPDEGLSLLDEIHSLAPETKVIVLTGQNDRANALRAIALGAYDFCTKPFEPSILSLTIDRAFRLYDLQEENRRLQVQQRAPATSGIITRDPQMQRICRTIEKVAPSSATVLLLGESGTGKELFARALHALSPRSAQRFVAINCAAIPETLLESELFGYEKGAYTGAAKRTIGKIETANRGTLFLDEIGDLPVSLQAKLLRFLQERVIERVGGREEVAVDVRIVCATHQSLKDQIQTGDFREDLYYRLAEIVVEIPPLRLRQGDATMLAHSFVRKFAEEHRRPTMSLSSDALDAIEAHAWPGNVRELENVIERLVVTGRSEAILPEELPMEVRMHSNVSLRPKRERRRTVADDLYKRLIEERESFWAAVYPLYMEREITRGNVRDVVRKGLEEARGNYKIVARLFNMEQRDYKRFLNFLRKHDCQLPFKEYR